MGRYWYVPPIPVATGLAGSLAVALVAAGCGGPPPAGVATIPVVAQTPGFLTFGPAADAYVEGTDATRNFGAATQLAADDAPVRRTFLRFHVTGLGQPALHAVLRLHTSAGVAGSPQGGSIRRVGATDWSETGLTWRNQPAIDAGEVATVGPVAPDRWYETDVSASVRENGIYSFAIVSSVGEAAYYDSREAGATGPRLVLTTESSASGSASPGSALSQPIAP